MLQIKSSLVHAFTQSKIELQYIKSTLFPPMHLATQKKLLHQVNVCKKCKMRCERGAFGGIVCSMPLKIALNNRASSSSVSRRAPANAVGHAEKSALSIHQAAPLSVT